MISSQRSTPPLLLNFPFSLSLLCENVWIRGRARRRLPLQDRHNRKLCGGQIQPSLLLQAAVRLRSAVAGPFSVAVPAWACRFLYEGFADGRPYELGGRDPHSIELAKTHDQSRKPQFPVELLRVHFFGPTLFYFVLFILISAFTFCYVSLLLLILLTT